MMACVRNSSGGVDGIEQVCQKMNSRVVQRLDELSWNSVTPSCIVDFQTAQAVTHLFERGHRALFQHVQL